MPYKKIASQTPTANDFVGSKPVVEPSESGSSRHRVHIGGQEDSPRPSASSDMYNQQSNYQSYSQPTPTESVKGFLDIQPEGHGFLRPKFIPSARDIYISQSQIRRFMLRGGDLVEG